MIGFVLALSAGLQVTAAVLAVRLVKVTGWRMAWIAIAAAMVLMGVRRSIAFHRFVFADLDLPPDLTAELVALVISVLMLTGMALVGALLASGKRTEEALRESRGQLAQAQRMAKLAHWEWRIDQRKLKPSPELLDIVGRTREELEVSDQEFLAFVYPDDRDKVAAAYGPPDLFGEPYEIQFRIVRPNGEIRVLLEIGEPMYDNAGKVIGNFGTVQDITERTRAEDALRQSEARYREIIEDSPVAIWEEDWSATKRMIDDLAAQGVVDWHDYFARHPDQLAKAYDLPTTVDISREILNIYGAQSKEALSESTNAALVPPEQLECFVDMLAAFAAGETSYDVEARDTKLDDTEIITRQRVTIPPKHCHDWSRVFLAIEDITERRATEAQLRHVQKMDAIGQLTGGVAHDFNNLLAVILGNLEIVEQRLAQDDWLRTLVERALGAADRGATLTQRLLAFSRKQALRPEAIDASRLVSGMTEMLRRTLGVSIEIDVIGDNSLWNCLADPAQLENALLNLAINARDAMPDGGKLTIETANARLDSEDAAVREELVPGDYVLLAVTDTGSGMASEVRERALEPFFTTKDVGRGSGLGLSMVFGFVRQSGGHLSIESRAGSGTSVKLYLPRARALGPVTGRRQSTPDVPLARGEAVLVVEDDAEVRTLVVSLLSELGYRIREAADSKTALKLLEKMPHAKLLLTDVVLPDGMSGRALAEQVRRRHKDMAILYMSGYTQHSTARESRFDDGVMLLHKPFRRAELAKAVRGALDGALN